MPPDRFVLLATVIQEPDKKHGIKGDIHISFDGVEDGKPIAQPRIYTDGVSGIRKVPLTTDEWYCRGAGLVKVERVEKLDTLHFSGGKVVLLTAEKQSIRIESGENRWCNERKSETPYPEIRSAADGIVCAAIINRSARP